MEYILAFIIGGIFTSALVFFLSHKKIKRFEGGILDCTLQADSC